MIMVDPKRVELSGYDGIPHLLAPVVVDLERVVGVLQWVSREMDQRYHKFSESGARHIADFNHRMVQQGQKKLPYLVVGGVAHPVEHDFQHRSGPIPRRLRC